jgi:hypothetical protein
MELHKYSVWLIKFLYLKTFMIVCDDKTNVKRIIFS